MSITDMPLKRSAIRDGSSGLKNPFFTSIPPFARALKRPLKRPLPPNQSHYRTMAIQVLFSSEYVYCHPELGINGRASPSPRDFERASDSADKATHYEIQPIRTRECE
jgi:hypothetical protein